MKKRPQITAMAVAVSAAATVANAVPIRLGDLIRSGDAIRIGDKIFDDFGFAAAHFDADDATIEFTVDPSGTYILALQGPFVSANGAPQDITFRYTLAAASGLPLLRTIDQSFVLSFAGTGGIVLIGEAVRDASFAGKIVAQSSLSHISSIGLNDLTDPVAEPYTGDQLVIDPPLSKVWVTKDIFFQANQGGIIGPSISVQSFHQHASDGGATVAFLGVAFSGLALFRRRMRA